eukprot:6635901-Pyramimonas_sp.AAC.1
MASRTAPRAVCALSFPNFSFHSSLGEDSERTKGLLTTITMLPVNHDSSRYIDASLDHSLSAVGLLSSPSAIPRGSLQYVTTG